MVTAFTFKHKQVAIIGLMLSVTASSCEHGTNEQLESGCQPHPTGSGMVVSISRSLQKYPAWIHACFTS